MPQPYSMDLRERVLRACAEGQLRRSEIADRFEISEAALYNWLKRARETGSFAPKPHAGGKTSEVDTAVLRRLVEEQNDRTLPEYTAAYAEETGRRFCASHFSRLLKQLDLPRKKRVSMPASSSGKTL